MRRHHRIVAALALASVMLAGACGGSGPTNQEQCDRYTRLANLADREGEPEFEYLFKKERFCAAARRDRLEAKVDGD